MDTRGFAHFGLNSEEHQSILQAIRAMQEPEMCEAGKSGVGSRGSGADAVEVSLRMEATRADRVARSCQAAAMQRVPMHITGRGHKAVRQMHLINQPRRCY
jgi:hypothetical protein